MARQSDRRTDEQMDVKVWADRQIDSWMDGQRDRQADRWMSRQTDSQMDE